MKPLQDAFANDSTAAGRCKASKQSHNGSDIKKDETKAYQTVIKIWMRGRNRIEMFTYGYVIGQTYI